MTHDYPEPDDEEGFLYVREWEDHRLQEEFQFLAGLFAAAAAEVAFRADHPEYRDGTGDISARDVRYYELADEVNDQVTRGDAFYSHGPAFDRDPPETSTRSCPECGSLVDQLDDGSWPKSCPHCGYDGG